jgi:hypothetical protein
MSIDYSKVFEANTPELIHLNNCEACRSHEYISEAATSIISGINNTIYGGNYWIDNCKIDIQHWIQINHAIVTKSDDFPGYNDVEYIDIETINENMGFIPNIFDVLTLDERDALIDKLVSASNKLNKYALTNYYKNDYQPIGSFYTEIDSLISSIDYIVIELDIV